MREASQMNLRSRPTEEEKLDFLVGEWSSFGHVSPGPFGPGGPATGKTSYHWAVGGMWLLYVSRLELSGLGSYEVHGGVTFNSRVGKYDAYAINSLMKILLPLCLFIHYPVTVPVLCTTSCPTGHSR
jgi:hypothetical protein